MSGGRYEFVVGGAFGPHLRSMFADLDIEDRRRRTRLVLHAADDAVLLSLLARIAGDDREVESVKVTG